MQYDPKLKIAMNEIREVLIRHGIGAVVCLHGEKQISEFMHFIDPPYSCAYWDKSKGGLRIKAKLSEYPSREEWEKTMGATVNMLVHFRNFGERVNLIFSQVLNKLSEQVDIQEGDSGYLSQQQLDN